MFSRSKSSDAQSCLDLANDRADEASSDGAAGKAPMAEARRIYRWCQNWTETLARLRQDFNGDLDQYLMFLVFKQGEMARMLSALETTARNDLPYRGEIRGMNAMSVADICGIPRETVRRKLKRLVQRRVITMGPNGLYYLAASENLEGPDDIENLARKPGMTMASKPHGGGAAGE
jgi:hypothetical protein